MLRVKVEEMNKGRESMYNRLLQAYMQLAASSGGRTIPAPTTAPYAELGMFEEVPLGDERGWKSEDLELGDGYEEVVKLDDKQ